MICQADEGNAMKHCEFVINRAGLGRGGEHLFLRWTGGNWDFFFNGFDITWTMIKTCSDQCMLLFCDRSLYCLCPFFSLGVLFHVWWTLPRETRPRCSRFCVSTLACDATRRRRKTHDTGHSSTHRCVSPISRGRKEPNQMFHVKIDAHRFHDRESRELGARH